MEIERREEGERWGCSNSNAVVLMVIRLVSFVSFFQECLAATEKLKQYIDTLSGKLSSVSTFFIKKNYDIFLFKWAQGKRRSVSAIN